MREYQADNGIQALWFIQYCKNKGYRYTYDQLTMIIYYWEDSQ